MSSESNPSVEIPVPIDKKIFFCRPGVDMETRLANTKSSGSALQNAAGFDEAEFKLFKDVLQQTARKHLDLSVSLQHQNGEQWQFFVNELWESKIEYMMENYEEQWPMMVYMHKYLGHHARTRQRKHSKENQRSKEDKVESDPSSTTRVSQRLRRRWTPVIEIPVKRKNEQNATRLPSASGVQPTAEARGVEGSTQLQPASSSPPSVSHAPVKGFLESCDPNLEEFLPQFINTGIHDESSLMTLVLSSRADRLSFLTDNFVDKMTLEQILDFNEDCELQSRYFA